MRLSLLILSTSLLSLSVSAVYDPKLSLRAVNYAGAAYCAYEDLDTWTCGDHCSANSKMTEVKRVLCDSLNSFAYTAYDKGNDVIVVAFRGTNGKDLANWVTNLDARYEHYERISGTNVHKGFHRAYVALAEQVRANVKELISKHPLSKVVITGHSLGGALATLAAEDLKETLNLDRSKTFIITFGQPRTGDNGWADHLLEAFPDTYFRIVHADDVVAQVPTNTQGFKHAGQEIWYPSQEPENIYKICINKPGQPENMRCSRSQFVTVSVDSHKVYLGVPVAKGCTRRQPSGTLMQELAAAIN